MNRRVQEAKQAEREKLKEKNTGKKKDGVKSKLRFQEEECIIDKLLSEIRHGFPLKKRQKINDDDECPTSSTIPSERKCFNVVFYLVHL